MPNVTTIKVSKRVLRELEKLRDKLGLYSLESAIELLLRENRRRLLESALGADKSRISSFKEEDRGEDRS